MVRDEFMHFAIMEVELWVHLADEPTLADGPSRESRIDAWNTTTPNLADEPTLADGPPKCNASWDLYYGMYLAAILDFPTKGGNFLLFLNN